MKAKMFCQIAGIISVLSFALSAEPNQLCKIFHHGQNQGQHASETVLEIAKVVFYFSLEPKVQLVDKKERNEQKQMVFFFPSTTIKEECTKMVQSLRKVYHPCYTIAVEQIRNPAGVRFLISYDAKKLEIAYDTFDSISLYKGVIFTFYDKVLLEKIKEQGQPLIRTVSNDQQSLVNSSVIIDCGHGGDDIGAVGFGEFKEKDLTLQIGLKVAGLLRHKGFDVHLTRNADTFIPLDERTRCYKVNPNRSILISIHANAANNPYASGIETFCLSPPLLRRCFKTMDEYATHVLEYVACDQFKKSNKLAICLHRNVIACANKKNPSLNDRQVKYAVSQILLGPVIPSVLIELGFLSNAYEVKLLKTPGYQSLLARGICLGVLDYFRSLESLS